MAEYVLGADGGWYQLGQSRIEIDPSKHRVLKDGVVQEDVVWADPATGEIEYLERHWSTRQLVRGPDGEVARGRAKGKVEVQYLPSKQTQPEPGYPDYPDCGCYHHGYSEEYCRTCGSKDHKTEQCVNLDLQVAS